MAQDKDTKASSGDTEDAKDAAAVTKIPSGLDVAITVPGTIVGGHDLQGTNGTERTDRPGEILGTPASSTGESSRQAARDLEASRSDYVTSEVDRANREELPKLGGAYDSGWEPGNASVDTSAAAKARAAQANTVGATPGSTAGSKTEAAAKADRG